MHHNKRKPQVILSPLRHERIKIEKVSIKLWIQARETRKKGNVVPAQYQTLFFKISKRKRFGL